MTENSINVNQVSRLYTTQNRSFSTDIVRKMAKNNPKRVPSKNRFKPMVEPMDPSSNPHEESQRLPANFKRNNLAHYGGSAICTTNGRYCLNQCQPVKFCWTMMMIVALTILIPSELDYFPHERHRPSGGYGSLVR